MSWEAPNVSGDGPTIRHLRFPDSSYGYDEQPLTVYAAIAPLYPKLRLTPRGLLKVAAETLPLLRMLVGEGRREELQVELMFRLSGSYLSELLDLGAQNPTRIADFALRTALPRYVGIVRFLLGDALIGDVVCDTTDIHRTHPKYGSILGLVPFIEAYEDPFREFTAKWLA
jgi:hypothetical protein